MTQSLLVFSHLRWNFVYQRPQHLLSRLAQKRRVVFFEEPEPGTSEKPYLEFDMPEPNVLVCRPHTPCLKGGYHDEQLPYLALLLKQLIADEKMTDYLLWFYTPMALPLSTTLKPKGIIYDCMDELSAFLNAPRQMIQRETALLKMADVVFTGGPSLYRAKKDRHPNVFCFPSSVDEQHFAQARGGAQEPDIQKKLSRPRLGFFGVLDERLDLNLLEQTAIVHPEWQIIMVGPLVKIKPTDLPRHKNIHYFGQQRYEDLPNFLSGWDVCLLPFALNEATKFISPTKTLEYMAAEKPIVSTPITDVADPYSHIVYLGDTPETFISSCERALLQSRMEQQRRVAGMRDVLSRTSWDATAEAINKIIDKTFGKRSAKRSAETATTKIRPVAEVEHPLTLATTGETPEFPHLIIGAGPTGLSAAYHLGDDSLLLEQNSTLGGWCRSIEDKGFIFDYAGHIMFSNDPYVHRMYSLLLSNNVHWQEREAWVFSKQTYTRYPFQGALYGLPPEVIKECIVGAIEARFGSIAKEKMSQTGAGSKKTSLSSMLPLLDIKEEPRNFEEFIYKVWGTGIAKHFAIPYNTKLWTLPLNEMETSWLGGRVPLPDLEEMLDGALHPVPKPMGPNSRFGYPLHGGFQALMDGFNSRLRGDVVTNAKVASVSPRQKSVELEDGRRYQYQTLISTMPLPELILAMGDEAPAPVRAAAKGLGHISIRNVNIGIGRANITDKHWIYLPEGSVAHRVFVQGNASPYCNPSGGFGLTCEISYSDLKPLPCEGPALIQRCVEDCTKIGLIKRGDRIITANELDMPHAYVIYDHTRARNVATIRTWLEANNIIPAGRYGEWEYYNSDHALLAGKQAAEKVRTLQSAAVQTSTLFKSAREKIRREIPAV
ncbi:NAD(P)-binding protein [Pelotalea chapellei]|uniref:NAD(P)-binding protein n=1 Tax=Pelotalea chapellei TaxID=44671 RepID=A0ABS5UCQ9_9BACT|nr:NAD(P)-binding protein [Pelotalea chapellei]MBT1073435.1 NAD(P)-binding protein [Pelotalea chapellei]